MTAKEREKESKKWVCMSLRRRPVVFRCILDTPLLPPSLTPFSFLSPPFPLTLSIFAPPLSLFIPPPFSPFPLYSSPFSSLFLPPFPLPLSLFASLHKSLYLLFSFHNSNTSSSLSLWPTRHLMSAFRVFLFSLFLFLSPFLSIFLPFPSVGPFLKHC